MQPVSVGFHTQQLLDNIDEAHMLFEVRL